jgi:hypothetical protein
MIIISPKTNTLVSSNVPAGDNQGYMFDSYLNTQTEYADLIEVEIEFNNSDRVALFNIDAYSVDLELTDDDTSTVVQTKTVDLEMSDGEYQQWIVEPLYIFANATLKISINKSGGTAKCGKCAYGLSKYVGATQYGVQSGFIDYSKKDTNEFGNTYLNVGSWAKKPEITTHIPLNAVDAVAEDLTDVRGTLVIFEGNVDDTDYETLRIMGFLNDWNIRIDNPTIAWVDFNIQGVI